MWLYLLVLCDCGFQSVCPLIEKDKKLMEAFWWERLRGKLGLVLMGRARLSKSLIQFSVDGWHCVPSLLFTRGQIMVEVMKITATSFKRSHACTATLSAPNSGEGYHWPTPPLEIPGHSQESLGHCLVGSLLLSPGAWCIQGSICALQESISQSCISFGSSMVRLMDTSSKRAYAIRKSATPRAPVPVAVHSWLHWHRRRSDTVLSQSLWGTWVLVCTRFIWALWATLEGMRLYSEWEFTPPTILLGLLLCPWAWGISSQLLLDKVHDEVWVESPDTV